MRTRNAVPPDVLDGVGRMMYEDRERLRALVLAWYKSEQDKLTSLDSEAQLRQAQGAAQAFRDLADVLEKPEAFRIVPVPARRGSP